MLRAILSITILLSQLMFSEEKYYSNKLLVLNDSSHRVYKIDSVNSFYLIYAERNTERIKIISEKTQIYSCTIIRADSSYNFSLESLWTKPIMIGAVNVSPSETPNVNCLMFNDSTKICLEKENGIDDLFIAKNVKGLCYINK